MKAETIPKWFPIELKEDAIAYLSESATDEPKDAEIRKRLVTDPRMEEVWRLFQRLPEDQRRQCMIKFLKLAPWFYAIGESMHITKKEKQNVKDLKAKLSRQIRNLTNTLEEVNTLGVLSRMRKTGLLKRLSYIECVLKERLASYKNVNISDILFGGGFEAVDTIVKRGSSNTADIYTREAVSIEFKNYFNRPYHRLSGITSLVISGDPTLVNATLLRDRTRKRRSNKRRGQNSK